MEIQCEFQHVWFWNGTKLAFTCFVKSAEIKKPMHQIKNFIGDYPEGDSNEDVKAIWFHQTVVKYFPRDLHLHFPNLTHLLISDCGLKRISKENLSGLENLMTLSIKDGKLKCLPDNLLEGMTKLREITFENCEIEFASSKLLEPLLGKKVLWVSFLGNENINANYAADTEGSLESLQDLMDLIDAQCKKPALHTVATLDNFKGIDQKIADLWTSGRFSDLTIVAGDRVFKVRKTFLLAQSPTFAKIFEDDGEATEIKIDEFSTDAVETLLHFIYAGEVPNGENAREKFLIADKFQVAEMKMIFEEILIDQLNNSNALDIFTLAHSTSSKFLKENAFAKISEMFPEKLSEVLMENLDKVRQLVEYRQKMDGILMDSD